MPVDGNSESSIGSISRRRWLQSAAATSLVAMAGCSNGGSSDDGDSTDTTGSGSDGPAIVEDTLKFHVRESSGPLPEENLNWWGSNSNGDLMRQLFTHSGTYSQTHNFDWMPMSVEGWQEDEENSELRVQVRDDVYWTQGEETIDPFTAGDLSTWYQLQRYMTPAADRTSNPAVVGWRVEGDDDRELVLELNPDGYNIGAVTAALDAQYYPVYRNGFFGDKLEELKNASGEDAKASVRKDIAEKEVTLSNDPPICMPWMLTDANPQTIRLDLNEDHWLAKADTATPRTLELKVVGGGSSGGYQALQSDEIHISDSSIPDSVPTSGIPDDVQQISYATSAGWTLKINYGGSADPFLGIDTELPREEQVAGAQQAKTRQGIAHAINFEDVLANHLGSRAGDLIEPFERAHPSSVRRIKDHYPDFYGQLPSYTERDTDAAAKRFEEAGLTKDGDKWVKPDGSQLTVTLQASSTDVSFMRTIRQDLGNFGINAELDTLGSQVWGKYDEGSYDAVMGWVQDQLPVGLETRGQMVQGVVWPNGALPEKYEVPPPGEMDADPSNTVNPRKLSSEFETESMEDHLETTKEMVWAFAYHLPDIPLMPWMGGYMINKGAMDWAEPTPEGKFASPTADNPAVYGSDYYMMGRLGARGQQG